MRIDPRTRLGRVHYTVRDLEGQIDFYCRILGFQVLWREGDTAALGVAAAGTELLRLTANPQARRYHNTTGLYHTAFLVPTRWDLAHLVRQIIETRTPVQGHSNHGTHLAIYLPDAEGNGIELAWDFPREVWPMENGRMAYDRMPREGVDIEALLEELERDPSPWTGLRPGTTVGHIHLHVADLAATRRFYHEILGFDITMDSPLMRALFLSAGGYHHHIGSNIWKGAGLPPAPPDALGLRYFTILLPATELVESLAARARDHGVPVTPHPDGQLLRDPSGHGVLLAAAPETLA
ncbi:MAG: VOC family protein [Limnochordales bacterium]|nr:VOC family protein [Limnochordales bacterium]